jgi:hypothetical protein
MRAALHVDTGTAAIDIRDPAGEQNHGSRASVAIGWHKGSFELQQSAIELTSPCRSQERQIVDQIGWLGIDLDLELVDLDADDDLCL